MPGGRDAPRLYPAARDRSHRMPWFENDDDDA
jgi:hypothetical protein